eukprot:m.28935 g.28935  ORF g.28935 m.28935 type:complete len:890 (-) comp8985_c0_seq1:40-2709(-)
MLSLLRSMFANGALTASIDDVAAIGRDGDGDGAGGDGSGGAASEGAGSASSGAGKRRRVRPQSVFHRTRRSARTGRPAFRSVQELPGPFSKSLEEQGLFALLHSLIRVEKKFTGDQRHVLAFCVHLKTLSDLMGVDRLADQPPHVQHTVSGMPFTQRPKLNPIDWLPTYGGTQAVCNVLMRTDAFCGRTDDWLRMANLCVRLLRQLCFANYYAAEDLAARFEIRPFLFSLLKHPLIFQNAVGLLEELLHCRADVLDLGSCGDFESFVAVQTKQQLASFSKVLALCIFDSEEAADTADSMQSAKKGVKPKASPARALMSKTIKENHRLLVESDYVLKGLVAVLRAIVDQPAPLNTDPSPRTLLRPLPSGEMVMFDFQAGQPLGDMRQLEELAAQIAREDGQEEDGEPRPQMPFVSLEGQPDPQILEHFEWLRPDEVNFAAQVASHGPVVDYHTLLLAVYQPEVLFVLCSLLAGPHKVKAQSTLASLGLPQLLNKTFDDLGWGRPHHPSREPVHGPGCECNPESSHKIQFLRLCHNFSDNANTSQYKRLFLTNAELEDMKRLGAEHGIVDETKPLPTELHCCGEQGLLKKIIDAFRNEPEDSPFRTFLASSLENYLRGAADLDRAYFVQCGVLEYVIELVLENGFKASVLQSCFDLLAEICKFNSFVFAALDKLLTQSKFDEFVQLTTRNLVASNVFIRVVFLSAEHFATRGDAAAATRLAQFVLNPERRVKLLCDLLSVVTVTDLDQENICCLNTSLLFLVSASRASTLPSLLETLYVAEQAPNVCGSHLKQLQDLVSFWRLFYADRPKDCESLERSSRIPFSEWRAVADQLEAADAESDTTLAYWLAKQDGPCDPPQHGSDSDHEAGASVAQRCTLPLAAVDDPPETSA